MIYDILEVFKKEYEKSGDKLILDNYTLKDGLYVKVNKDNTCEYFISETVKKEKVFKTIDGVVAKNKIDWFKERDYYSEWLNANKMINDKKIHNINYLSLFVKIDSYTSSDAKKLIDKDAIKYHFKSLCDYKKFNKPKEKEILKSYNEYLSNKDRKKDLIQKYKFIEENILSIVEKAKEHNIINYIKIFFDEDIELYKKESEIYYSIKIFNDIGHSKKIDDLVYGLSDSNMNLNSKKPYLEQKAKKINAPFIILDTDALLIKKFLDWLKFQDLRNKNPLNNELFLNRDFKEKDLIIDFDYLPLKIEKLENPIYVTNYLKAYDYKTKNIIEDYTIEELYQLENKTDEIFYNKQLTHNYFSDIKVSQYISKNLQTLLYETKTSMLNYFKKYDDRGFFQVIKKYGSDFVIEHLRQNRELKAKESLNLKLSLLKHKGENIMDIQNIQKEMITKLETSNYTTLKSEEFFYLCGQIAKYLLSQSEAYQKNADLLEPFLRANNAKKLKKDIEVTYFKYKHKISLNHIKLNNAMSLIMAYDGVEKLSKNMDSFLVGVLSDNIFYMKKEVNENE
jgi:CRISPR-associated protein Csh1